MDGFELCIRFAGIPNELRYCGPAEAIEPFRDYLEGRSRSESELASLFERFEGLYPYLQVIAERNGLEFTDARVVEAYWIGSELLDRMTSEDYRRIIGMLAERGLPQSIAQALIRDLPAGLVPHHNAHVCYVGPGRTAHTVRATIDTMERCRIAPARVLRIVDSRHLLVEQAPLLVRAGRFVLGDPEPRTLVYHPELHPELKVDDVVATHWGVAALILSEAQLASLERYDRLVRDAIPMARPD